jgi:hypothetical protein
MQRGELFMVGGFWFVVGREIKNPPAHTGGFLL